MPPPSFPLAAPRPILLVFGFLAIFAAFHLLYTDQFRVFATSQPPASASLVVHTRPKLHLLLPVDEGADRKLFCKTLMSAHVHGYEPTVINWDIKGGRDELLKAKITGVNSFLQSLPASAAENGDLVLMIDALDCWLQLPASIVIDRFLSLDTPMVVGAEKRCWPGDENGPVCTGVPDSPLPKGTFPVNPEDPTGQFHLRPRWANSGTIMGSVEAMLPIYAHLHRNLHNSEQSNDQGYFNELLQSREITLDYWHRLFYSNFGSARGDVAFSNVPSRDYLEVSPIAASSPFAPAPTSERKDSAIPSFTKSKGHSHITYNVSDFKQSDSSDDIVPYHLLPTLLLHTLTASHPAVFHFNEPWNKHLLDEYWGRLWWTKSERRWRAPVIERLDGEKGKFGRGKGVMTAFAHEGGESKGFWEICPAKVLNMTIDEDWLGN